MTQGRGFARGQKRLKPQPGENREAWLERVLENWGIWAKPHAMVGPHDPAACGSIERLYPIPIWEDEEPPPEPPNVPEAEAVEAAWSIMPQMHKAVLKGRYVDCPLRNARKSVWNEDHTAVISSEEMPDEMKDRIRASRIGLMEAVYLRVLKEARQMMSEGLQGRVVVDGWTQPQRA